MCIHLTVNLYTVPLLISFRNTKRKKKIHKCLSCETTLFTPLLRCFIERDWIVQDNSLKIGMSLQPNVVLQNGGGEDRMIASIPHRIPDMYRTKGIKSSLHITCPEYHSLNLFSLTPFGNQNSKWSNNLISSFLTFTCKTTNSASMDWDRMLLGEEYYRLHVSFLQD